MFRKKGELSKSKSDPGHQSKKENNTPAKSPSDGGSTGLIARNLGDIEIKILPNTPEVKPPKEQIEFENDMKTAKALVSTITNPSLPEIQVQSQYDMIHDLYGSTKFAGNDQSKNKNPDRIINEVNRLLGELQKDSNCKKVIKELEIKEYNAGTAEIKDNNIKSPGRGL